MRNDEMTVLDRFSLEGKTALVTGSTRGLGHAFALALAEAGADIVVVGRDETAAQSVARQIESLGREALVVITDVTSRDSVTDMTAAALDRFGAIDVLVNNAGACIHRPALEVTPEEWAYVMNTNVTALWDVSQIVGQHMVERGTGSIVNIGSIS